MMFILGAKLGREYQREWLGMKKKESKESEIINVRSERKINAVIAARYF
jgi:hypothetical protein